MIKYHIFSPCFQSKTDFRSLGSFCGIVRWPGVCVMLLCSAAALELQQQSTKTAVRLDNHHRVSAANIPHIHQRKETETCCECWESSRRARLYVSLS